MLQKYGLRNQNLRSSSSEALIVLRRRPNSPTTHDLMCFVFHHLFFLSKLAAADALRGLQVSATPVPDAPKRAIPTQGPAGTRPSTSGDFFVVGAVWVTCLTMVVVIAVVFIRLCPCVRSTLPQGACTTSLWPDWRSRVLLPPMLLTSPHFSSCTGVCRGGSGQASGQRARVPGGVRTPRGGIGGLQSMYGAPS